MDSQSQNTSLQRLQNVEKTIVRVLELAGGVTDELSNPSGPRKDLVNKHCAEFMQSIKDAKVRSKMVEIHDGERLSVVMALKTAPPPQGPYPSVQWNLNDRTSKKDRMINALQKDVQIVAMEIRLRTLSPSRDRYRSPSPRRAEGKNAHAWGDVRDCLARPKENQRLEVLEENSGLFYNLAYTASHETTMVVPPKVLQTKVEMVLEQLVSSPFTVAVKNARPPKNFTAPKFNQYDPKTGDAVTHGYIIS
ncbi:hypothetical protein RHSIM_Rhsim13G0147700 [Rhododendron simsii]|uniref:Mediator of RNA polymerase II transcription subunit 11 n=1 Tax=Rhododendron simsii TaxID=118357 RepID=A0A834G1S4_RHOSS|nr:hypothetical protein RHSIM_Rhsim13G0147700 [Rhododendron simsii]